MNAPIFVAGVNVFANPIRFQASTDATGTRAGMGNDGWNWVANPLYDADNALFDGLTEQDFPGFVPDIQPTSDPSVQDGQAGFLYGPRDYASIVKPDWRFRWRNVFYHIVDPASYDFNHPLTNENFGYVSWAVHRGG